MKPLATWLPRVPRSLRARILLALVLIGTIPLAAVGLALAALDRQALGEQSSRELIGLARGVAGQLGTYQESLLTDSRAIAALPATVRGTPAERAGLLRELFHHYNEFSRLGIYGLNGVLIAASDPHPTMPIRDQVAFRTATERGQQSWSIEPSLVTSREALIIHTPIRDEAQSIVGVLRATVDLENLSTVVSRVQVGDGGRAYVLDTAGRVLLHPDPALVRDRPDYTALGLPVGAQLAGTRIIRYTIGDETVIAAVAPTSALGWTVVVERPEAAVLAPAERAWQIALAGVALSTLLAILVAVALARTLTQPLSRLATAARAFGAGDPTLPLPLNRLEGEEVSTVLAAFAEMRERLVARTNERVRAEEELRRSRDQLEVILGGVADGIVVHDVRGDLIYANQAASHAGYPLEPAFPGEPATPSDIRDERGEPVPFDALPSARVLRGQSGHERLLRFRVRGTGEERWSVVQATPVRDTQSQIQLAITIMHDVTAHRRAEEVQRFLAEASVALASSLDYQTTLERVADLAVPFFADWCTVDVRGENGGIDRVAVVCADPRQRPLADLLHDRYSPDPERPEGVPKVFRTGRSELYAEITDDWLERAAQDEEHLALLRSIDPTSYVIVPMIAGGATLGVLMFVRDGGRPRYTPADVTLAEDLARRAALAVDNARLYQEARQAVAAREEFLSVAAHELKTPITSLRGFAQLTLHRLATTGTVEPERLRRAIEVIDEQSVKLARLVSQLLDVSRIEAGRLVLDREPIDVSRIVEAVLAEARTRTTRHDFAVPASGRVVADVDPLRLEQVVTNLIDNAIKYSPDGGTIDVAVWQSAPTWVTITVRDRGVGVPPEHRTHIFDRFYQAHAGGHLSGMGLGLYISRQIIELHGGRLEADFPSDGGTRLTITLPISPGAPTPRAAGAEVTPT